MTLACRFAVVGLLLGLGACAAKPPQRYPIPFHIIAHRGASADAPENTLPAFERALALGAFEVELDVRRSRDGLLFLFHDATLDEKTAGRGAVHEHDSAQLRQLEIGSWFDRRRPGHPERFAGTPLITLRELFSHFGSRLFYHVEIKGSEAEIPGELVELIRATGLVDRVMLTSFSIEQLQRSREIAPELRICWLLERVDDPDQRLDSQKRWMRRAQQAGFVQVGIPASDISPDAVRFGQRRGLEVRAWGIETPEHIDRVIDAGANGMTIDWPDRLIERLLRHNAGL